MKKNTFLVLSLLASGFASAQATLEHSYTTSVLNYEKTNVFQLESGLHYYTVDDSNTMHIYNSNHSLVKTIAVPVQSDYSINKIAAISDKLFNVDDSIEFIVITESNWVSGAQTVFSTKLINENGIVVQDFGNRNEMEIVKGGDVYKLITTLETPFTGTEEYIYDVYALPGTTLGNAITSVTGKITAYPIPANNVINLLNDSSSNTATYVDVFDIQGKKVLRQAVEAGQKNISLNVAGLSTGLYTYRINGVGGKFLKK